MQRYTTLFITVNALHVSGGFSAHHQELKTVHTASGIYQACLLLPLAGKSWNSPTLAVASRKLNIYQMLCLRFELLMMGGETAWNIQSIDSIKEYFITLHLLVILKRIH